MIPVSIIRSISKNGIQLARTLVLLWMLAVPGITHAGLVHLELIIFAHDSPSNEWIPDKREIISVRDLDSLNEATEPTSEKPKIVPVRAVRLVEIAKILDQHPDYEILNYLSWIQDTLSKKKSEPVVLNVEFSDQMLFSQLTLTGTAILFEIGELLQFEIDATYFPAPDVEVDTINIPEPLVLQLRETEHVLQEARRVTINDFHYFDHPKFGAILSVIRPPKPELFVQ